MNDPHVEALYYDADSASESISYLEPPEVIFANEVGRFVLKGGQLTVTLDVHFSDEASAREKVGAYLRAWEVESDLLGSLGQLRFKFNRCKIVDRNPLPRGAGNVVPVVSGDHVMIGESVVAHMTRGSYPAPPRAFVLTSDVVLAHMRWMRFCQGKEPMQGMAYFVLTMIEDRAGSRREAAKRFNIDNDVLRKIGELSSTTGGAESARKARYRDMTDRERAWLEAAIRKVIHRIGEYASGVAVKKLGFSDLPILN